MRNEPSEQYPHLIFSIERNNHIDVWRVPHERAGAWIPGSFFVRSRGQ